MGAGLGLCTAGGRLRGQRIRPGSLSGQGKHWPHSLPFLHAPTHPPRLPQGLPHRCWTPHHGWVPLDVGAPPLPRPPLRGAIPEVQTLLLLPLPSLWLPQDPPGWRGPRWAEDQAWDLNRFQGVQVGRGNLATLPFDPLPSQGFLISLFGRGIPSPPPTSPQGHQSRPPPLLLPLHSPHTPRPTWSLGVPPLPLGVCGPPPVPGRCPSCEETRIPPFKKLLGKNRN